MHGIPVDSKERQKDWRCRESNWEMLATDRMGVLMDDAHPWTTSRSRCNAVLKKSVDVVLVDDKSKRDGCHRTLYHYCEDY